MRGKVILAAVWAVGVLAASFVTLRAIDAAGQQILSQPYQPVLSTQETPDGSTSEPTKSPKPSTKATKGHKDKQPSSHQTTQAPPPPPTPSITQTWRGTAGYVVASCSGQSVTVDSVTPNNGYRTEVSEDSSSHATVHFEPRNDQGSEMVLVVTCSGGSPQFSVQSDS